MQLAIDLELRYRGLRSPHKLKGGVSGCARECAEARGKDFGVIATEKGWNLYVGGNGGATPAHAQLLAGDLDTETLVRYLDRFLMYYIRTADRLQRTAPWVDSLDGGLDRVREVVVDDALGLGAELEAAMARHVDGYFDEWRATLEDPEKLRRFVSFVNAPGHPGPAHHLPRRARPGACRPTSAGPVLARRPRSRWGAVTADRLRRTPVCRLDDIEVEGGVAALVDGEAVAIFRTHDGNVYAISNYDPVRQRLGAGARHRRHPRRAIPFVASPMHKQAFDLRTGQCLDDAAVRVPTYDVRVDRRHRARRRPVGDPGESVTDPPARRLPDRRHRRPQGRRAGRRCWSAAAPTVEWAPALSLDPNQVDDDALRAATEEVLARPVDLFLATTGIGMKAWFAAAESLGAARRPAARRWAPPRSWRAARRASARCAGAGCASCGRRSRSASTTCWRTCAAATSTGLRIVVQEHGQSLSMVAHALRRQGADVTTVTVYRVASADDPEPMFRLIDLVADRALDAVTFTSAPAVAALMEAAGSTGRRDERDRRLPGRRASPPASGPVTAAAFEMWGVPTIFPDRSRLVAMVKQLETELPVARRRAPRSRWPGTRCCCTARTVLLDGVEVEAVAGAVRRAAGAAGQPRPRRLPARAAGRAARRAPPAPSTPSRWRSPGCARRSAPGPCRPSSSAATGWRCRCHEAGDRRARHPARRRQRGRAPSSPRSPARGSGLPAVASYVELCAPSLRRR